ncbi:MAG: cytochrome c biogenesis protein, partial [Candidatus Micrarchaeota archaeon]
MRIAWILGLLVLLVSAAWAAFGPIYVDYYEQAGCAHCEAFEKILEQVKAEGNYTLDVNSYEIRLDPAGRDKFVAMANKFGIPGDQWATPTVVLNDQAYFIGEKSKEDFERMLYNCSKGNCTGDTSSGSGILNPVTAFFTGLMAGFNPCLFAVLLFLITYSLGMSENKMRLVKLTISFSLGIFFAYFIIGFGLLSFASVLDMGAISKGIAVVVILLGLWTIKDYKNPKSLLVETPENIKGMSESLTKKNSVFAAFALGGIFSLVKAPCVGGLYLLILDKVSSADLATKAASIPLLAAFNLGLVFPLLLISGAVLLGVPPKKIEEWREKNKYSMRIFLG